MTVLITYMACHCPSKPLNCPKYVNIMISKLLLVDGSPQLEKTQNYFVRLYWIFYLEDIIILSVLQKRS